MMYTNFSNEFAIKGIWLPSLFKGFATSTLYVALGLYTTRKLGINKIMTAAGMIILVRSFLGSGIFASLYTYLLYAVRVKHVDYLAGLTDPNNFLVKEHGSARDLYKYFQQQAILTASKTISGYIILIGIFLLTALLGVYLYRMVVRKVGT